MCMNEQGSVSLQVHPGVPLKLAKLFPGSDAWETSNLGLRVHSCIHAHIRAHACTFTHAYMCIRTHNK